MNTKRVSKAALARIGLQIVAALNAGKRAEAASLYEEAAFMRESIGDTAGAAISRQWAADLRLPPPDGKPTEFTPKSDNFTY